MTNIALIYRVYWRNGAIPLIVRDAVHWLIKKGKKVTIIASDVNEKESDGNITFARTFISKIRIFDFTGLVFAFTSFFKLLIMHRRQPIELIISHDSTGFYGTYLFSKIYKVPAIVFFHGWIYNPIREKAYPRPVTFMYKLNARFCARHAAKIGCVSQEIASGMKTLGATDEKIELFHNSIDLDKFTNKLTPKSTNDKVVLFVGRLAEEKGVKFLIKAIPEILRKVSSVKFIIIGAGSQEVVLKNLSKKLQVSEKVLFKGNILNKELPRYYSQADILVIPSLSEGHALVPIEALACGTPVVGTRIDGIIETVVDGYNGLLIEPKDHMSLASAITRVLSDDKLLDQLTINAHPSVQKFSWEHTVDRLIKITD